MLGVAAGCGRQGKEAPKGGSEVPPSKVNRERPVELTQAGPRPLQYEVETVGYLEADQTDIAAGAMGVVDEVFFQEGQWVEKGTLLLLVEQDTYKRAYELAKSNLDAAKSKQDGAKLEYESRRNSDIASSRVETEKARLGFEQAKFEVAVAERSLDLARLRLERSQVRAPYAGQINQRKIVTRGYHVEEKTVVATMANLNRLRLVGWVPEKAAPVMRDNLDRFELLRELRLVGGGYLGAAPWSAAAGLVTPAGMEVRFELLPFPNNKEFPFRGRVFYMSTASNSETRMFECKAEVFAPGLEGRLKPGFTARIKILLEGAPPCVVPAEAVRSTEQGSIAFVPVKKAVGGKEEWVAKARVLKVGLRTRDWVEVLSGLEPGDWIVSRDARAKGERKGPEAVEDGTLVSFPEEQRKLMESAR